MSFEFILTHNRLVEYSITAQFKEGDPAYDWIVLFLVRTHAPHLLHKGSRSQSQTQRNIWRKSREFRVSAKSSQRTWGVDPTPDHGGNADYVPTYEVPQIFRWKGCWVEIRRDKSSGFPGRITSQNLGAPGQNIGGASIFLTHVSFSYLSAERLKFT